MQKELKEGLVSGIKPIREEFTKSHNIPTFLSIIASADNGEEELNAVMGDIAEQYLEKFACESGADKTFGLRHKDGKFYIWIKETNKKENNIIVCGKKYVCTPGLWELIVKSTPDENISLMVITVIC